MKKVSVSILAVFLMSVLIGCVEKKDPTKDELGKGAAFNNSDVAGEVTHLWMATFTGDQLDTTAKKGEYYFCIKIVNKDEKGGAQEVVYRGVPLEEFKKLVIGEKLPLFPLLTLQGLSKIEGKIVGKESHVYLNRFFIVVDDMMEIKFYRIDKETYYKRADLGLQLPMQPQ